MNVEAANDVDPKYYLNPRSIVSIQVRVGDVWVGVASATGVYSSMWLQGKIHVGESGVVRLWEVARFNKLRGLVSTSLQPDKNLCVCVVLLFCQTLLHQTTCETSRTLPYFTRI